MRGGGALQQDGGSSSRMKIKWGPSARRQRQHRVDRATKEGELRDAHNRKQRRGRPALRPGWAREMRRGRGAQRRP
ncbi:hypothetical protein NDU88_009523 [Pleurodeles waltl]|uniref:Uncharacterized protein n=1 Tax=Pleurodeles waltl TaxID=8319 RepID=A0AAV7QUT8_PLEWA|nr:hypothetical protein NDU88_009523 [Pleurodeles waltl]